MSAIGAPAAAAIQTAGSLITTNATNKTNQEIARETNAANLKLAQQQNEWNLEQWNRENAYNDPSAQVQRLRNAGLSAAAAASAASGNTASPLQSVNLDNQQQPAPAIAPDMSALSGMNLIGAARELMALRKESSEANMLEQDEGLHNQFLLTELDVKQWTAETMKQQLQMSLKEFPYKLESIKAQTNLYKIQRIAEKVGIKQMNANIDLIKQRFKFLNDWNDKQLDLICEEISNAQKQGKKIEAETSNIQQQTANLQEQNKLIKEETKEKIYQNILTSHGAPETVAGRISALMSSGQMSLPAFKQFCILTRENLHRANKEFSATHDDRNFYNQIINEGNAKTYGQGLYNFNTLAAPADWLTTSIKRAFGK